MNSNTNDSGSPSNAKGTTRTEYIHHDSSAKELFDRFWGDDS